MLTAPQTIHSFERLQNQKRELCAELASWSPETLRFRMRPNSWTGVGVVEHLVRTEEAILAQMRKNRAAENPIAWGDRVRSQLLIGLMWLPTRLQVPQSVVASVSPKEDKELSALAEEWCDLRAAYSELLVDLSQQEAQNGIFRHPVSGWMDANATLHFIRSHIAHHVYQLRRIRRATKTLGRG